MTIDQLKAYKRKAKAQRDNWKRRAIIYKSALLAIHRDYECCGNCRYPGLTACPVGVARAALIKEEEAGK